MSLVFKLVQSAQQRWLRIQKFDRLTQIIEGVKFTDGVTVSYVQKWCMSKGEETAYSAE